MDFTLPSEEVVRIEEVLAGYQDHYVAYHALRTRKSGPRRFVDLHLLVRGEMSVQQSHNLCNKIEGDINHALGQAIVTIHVEPAEDKTAWKDDLLDGPATDNNQLSI
jgi:divalent metal cation (Fe/Co/Zn/Cd) transporter